MSTSTDGGANFTNNYITGMQTNSYVTGVYASGSNVYVAFNGEALGLYISRNGGLDYTKYTMANGLGSDTVWSVLANGNTVYAATEGGLSISTNGGFNYTNYTTANGLGGNNVEDVYAIGSTVYAATHGGLSISTNGGTSFTNYTMANGLGSNQVFGVYAIRNTVYAATGDGLGIAVAPLVWNTTTGTWNGTAAAWNSAVGNTFTFTNGDAVIFSGTAGGTVTISGAIQPSSVNVSATSGTYSFVSSAGNLLTGTGGLTKSGGGTLVLSGSNAFTGPTNVAGGRLAVDRALGNSHVTVLAAAEVGGSGSIGGPISVAAGGTLSPGNSIESLATGTATFAAGAVFEYEVDSSNPLSLGSAADLLVVNGSLNLDPGNATILTLTDLAGSPNPFVNHTTIFALVNYSGSWNGGLFTLGGNVLADGEWFTVGSQEWVIDYNRTSAAGIENFTGDFLPGGSFVTITAVPEPSTVAMALAGMACGGISMWRRRRRTRPNGRSVAIAASLAIMAACVATGSLHASPITIDWVTVGDPGNAADTTGNPNPTGAVADAFQIMKYEVTNTQYAAFLNAVASTDAYSLYNTSMGSSVGGITRSGSSGSYAYTVRANMGDKPVNKSPARTTPHGLRGRN